MKREIPSGVELHVMYNKDLDGYAVVHYKGDERIRLTPFFPTCTEAHLVERDRVFEVDPPLSPLTGENPRRPPKGEKPRRPRIVRVQAVPPSLRTTPDPVPGSCPHCGHTDLRRSRNRWLCRNKACQRSFSIIQFQGRDLIGKVYGWLTVTDIVPHISGRPRYWRCLCKCGAEIDCAASALLMGRRTSCGCARRYPRRERKGLTTRPDTNQDTDMVSLPMVAMGHEGTDLVHDHF